MFLSLKCRLLQRLSCGDQFNIYHCEECQPIYRHALYASRQMFTGVYISSDTNDTARKTGSTPIQEKYPLRVSMSKDTDMLPRIQYGHVAKDTVRTCCQGYSTDMLPRIQYGHVAKHMVRTCCQGHSTDMLPRIQYGHVAKDTVRTCCQGYSTDMLPRIQYGRG